MGTLGKGGTAGGSVRVCLGVCGVQHFGIMHLRIGVHGRYDVTDELT